MYISYKEFATELRAILAT